MGWQDPETLGLAGAIQKRWWEHNAQRQHLEQSLEFYRRGWSTTRADGYTGINTAFVLDLLASQDAAAAPGGKVPAPAQARRDEASAIRRAIIRAANRGRPPRAGAAVGARPDWWTCATLAEAYFGLRRYRCARRWLAFGLEAGPAGWERESTARQLARIFVLRVEGSAEEAGDAPHAWQALSVLYDGDRQAVRTAFMGKVGLALSGGGFRASLFHLGVLARLAQADVLRHVEVLSCVSGGSIVGAHYYLALKQALETQPDGSVDYVALVNRVARTFVDGVQRNLRMRALASLSANLARAWNESDSRTRHLARLYESEIFARLFIDGTGRDCRIRMRNLRIVPHQAKPDFTPRACNWQRRDKVPVLVLNATTLNTGHNWQFTAGWMGEPPGPIDSDVDGNDWLRRMRYDQAPSPHGDITLGEAVAASAGVPGLFEPLDLAGLYDGRTVRLVDGGVHDNQGVASLLEQECSVIIASDASGQMTSLATPSGHPVLALMRSDTVLQARVRQAQHRELETRQAAALLRGVAFLHLQRDLPPAAVDWVNCTEPEALFGDRTQGAPPVTSYGMRSEIQRLLAGIRTDLDAFHLAEAYALMTSGYRMAARYALDAFRDVLPAQPRTGTWFFQDIDRHLDPAAPQSRYSELHDLLKESGAVALKAWKVSWTVRQLTLGAVVLLVVLLASAWWAGPAWMRTSIAWLMIAAGGLIGLAGLGSIAAHIAAVRPLGRLAGGISGSIAGVLTALASRLYLATLDPAYRDAGALGLAPPGNAPRPTTASSRPPVRP